MRMICNLLYVISISAIKAQYSIRTWNTTITNVEANNHEIPLVIHYPSNIQQSYPLMVFYHGWECFPFWYNFIWQTLVPQGYIIAMPGDYTASNTTDENKCAISQRYTLDWLKLSCNNNVSCPLYQMIGNKSIAVGHSMGGGTVFLSSSSNYSLAQNFIYSFDAAFTLSGCGTSNDILKAVKYINVPIFIFTASHDCMCPPKTTAFSYYQALPNNTCRFVAEINNGSHCGFMDAPPVHQDACNVFDTASCPLSNHENIPLQMQLNITMEYLILFTQATMKDNNSKEDFERIATKLQMDETTGIMTFVSDNC